jgi:hypothetical protein
MKVTWEVFEARLQQIDDLAKERDQLKAHIDFIMECDEHALDYMRKLHAQAKAKEQGRES